MKTLNSAEVKLMHNVVINRVCSRAVHRKTKHLSWSRTFGKKRDEQLSKYM